MAPRQASVQSALTGRVVCPGDEVLSLCAVAASAPAGAAPSVRLGASLLQCGDGVVATRGGVLRQTAGGKLWVEGSQRRYLAAQDDCVVGVVLEKHAEARVWRSVRGVLFSSHARAPPAQSFSVDVGGPFPATLPALAFENATRRNRPNLTVGSLVYARVESAPRDAEPLLSCTDAAGKAAAFGPLTAGLPFALQTRAARALLARPPPRALAALGAALSFEMVVGVNGRCWVLAGTVQDTVLVANALQQAADMGPEQALALVQALLAQRGT